MLKLIMKNKLLFLISILLSLSILSCKFASIEKTTSVNSINQSIENLEYALENKKDLDEATKIIIKNTIADLKDSKKTEEEKSKIEKQLIEKSEKAGAGNFIYTILYIISGIIVIIFLIFILRKFSFFG